MPIRVNAAETEFHLQGGRISYIIRRLPDGRLCHLYFGPQLAPGQPLDHLLRAGGTGYSIDGEFSPSVVPAEYPSYGTGDLREPCLIARDKAGYCCADLRLESWEMLPGKPMPAGLPACFGSQDDCETLVLHCIDRVLRLTADLYYTVFADHDVVVRRVQLHNLDEVPMEVARALSGCLELPQGEYDLTTFDGAWARERVAHRAPLRLGTVRVGSRSGFSSHMHNPLLAVCRSGADEEQGEWYALNLVYSGSFMAAAERSPMDTVRLVMGIDPDTCLFRLEAGERLTLPELVMAYSSSGAGELTCTFHRFYREHLVRKSPFAERPVLLNNWEATYFDFDQQRLEQISAAAAKLGADLFVLDDGWFGHRNADNSSLGDWTVNREKLPGGLEGLCASVHAAGMEMGLWFEPECISEDSDLYRAHPDWCIHIPGRDRTRSRNQLIADITRPEVRRAIMDQVAAVLDSAPIRYVKWDMNRPMTEPGGAQTARPERFAYEYMLGLYAMLEEFTTRFPHILLEGCAAGGARFDPGMLYYCPQIWASDNTDADCRLDIQYGTAFAYPVPCIGSHVSAVPNHQTGRTLDMESRFASALCGTFGYELDPTTLTEEERACIPDQIRRFRLYDPLIRDGEYYRFLPPVRPDEDCCVGFVSRDKRQALVIYTQRRRTPNTLPKSVRLRGLDPDRMYRWENGGPLSGQALAYAGLPLGVLEHDGEARVILLTACEADGD